jgi:hypothetical protein
MDSSALRVIRAVKEHLKLQQIELLFCQSSSNIHLKFCLAGMSSNSTLCNLEEVFMELSNKERKKMEMLQVHVVPDGQQSSSFRPLEFLYHNESSFVRVQNNMKRSNSAPQFSWR